MEEPHTATDAVNAYVGPRPFCTGQKLYGRDKEAQQIASLLISQRIVLLHSPSGAGKTSLIHAKIVPALQKRRFLVPTYEMAGMPAPQPVVIRVNQAFEECANANRYVLSTLLSLELHRPPEKRRNTTELAVYTIDQYLDEEFPDANIDAGATSSDGKTFQPLLLLIDQFEELLTMDQTDLAAKKEFLKQLGEALRNEGRWALFSIREDFLGSFEPFRTTIPTGLTATYHLGLLKAEVAINAIKEPAQSLGVSYEDGVVEKIIEDLRQTRVQKANGTFESKPGLYVEPVHLQVVCQSLWQMKGDATQIRNEHLQAISEGEGTGVDEVLASYYAQSVTQAAEEGGVTERSIREWFSNSLIGVQKVRRPILVSEAVELGMTLKCLEILDKAFLIRRETRSGAQWYELAHDRLMNPIVTNNKIWRTQNLSSFQIRAELWDDRNRIPSLLIHGDALKEAQAEVKQHEIDLTKTEEEFLEASFSEQIKQAAVERIERNKKRNRILVSATAILSCLTFISIYQTIQAHLATTRAEAAKQEADWVAYAGLISQAKNNWESGYLRLGLNYRNAYSGDQYLDNHGWEYKYLEALFSRDHNTFFGHEASVSSVAFNPDGKTVASGSFDKSVRVWDLNTRKVIWSDQPSEGQGDWIYSICYSPDGKFLLSTGDSQSVNVWDAQTGAKQWSIQNSNDIISVSISSDNQWVVIAERNGTVKKFDFKSGKPLASCANQQRVRSIAVTPISHRIIYGCDDGSVYEWNGEQDSAPQTLYTHEKDGELKAVQSVAISHDERWIISGAKNGLKIWDAQNQKILTPQIDYGDDSEQLSNTEVTSVAFDPCDGNTFAVGTMDGEVFISNIRTKKNNPHQVYIDEGIPAHIGTVSSIAFRPNTPWHVHGEEMQPPSILTGGVDCMINYFNGAPDIIMPVLKGDGDIIWRAAFNPQGDTIASANNNNTIDIWRQRPVKVPEHTVKESGEKTPFPATVWESFQLKLIAADDKEHLPTAGKSEIIVAQIHDEIHFKIFNRDGVCLFDSQASHFGAHESSLSILHNIVGDLVGKPQNEIDKDREQILDHMTSIIGFWRLEWRLETTLKGHSAAVWGLAWSPDGRWVASGSVDKTAKIWDPKTGECKKTLLGNTAQLVNVDWSPDGKWIASSGADGIVRLWDANLESDGTAREFRSHGKWVSSVAFSPDSKRLISGSADMTVKVWDVESGQLIQTLEGHTDVVHCLAYAEDGKLFASGSDDTSIIIWDAETLEQKQKLISHSAWVTHIAFHPDNTNRQLVSGSQDNTIKLWSIDAAQNVLTLKKHKDTVWCVDFSSDGQTLISGSADNTIRLWDTHIDEHNRTKNEHNIHPSN